MKGTLFRYVAREYARFFCAICAALCAISLVADFVDRAKAYTGPHWLKDVAVLYGYKLILTFHQFAPAALLLAAGVAVSSLRKRGEVTAMRALAFGPSSIFLPIAAVALAVGVGLVGFNQAFVAHAGRRVDEITLNRFHRWGDWRFYYAPKSWFRHGKWLFHLREGNAEEGFEKVTLLKVSPDFHLLERLDAGKMSHLDGTRWRLTGVVDRDFSGEGISEMTHRASVALDLGLGVSALNIHTGRPQQMRASELIAQIHAREKVGLPFRKLLLALHDTLAYPLAGLPAALAAVGLALRAGRRGHLTVALMEGLCVLVVLWGLLVVGRALALSGRIPVAIAAWAPFTSLSFVAAFFWLKAEGVLGLRSRHERSA